MRQPEPPEDCPQQIADDYPGWDIGCRAGEWTATCPAVSVRASTAAGLRAAIEAAIGGAEE